MFLPALVAKFLSLSAVAQAASGVGIAVVAFTGAGATGMLGDDVQTSLTSVVGAADVTGDTSTPAPSPTATTTPTVEAPAIVTPADVTPGPVEPRTPEEAQKSGPTAGEKFGDWVHEAYPDGKADGQRVSYWAQRKHVDPSEVEGTDDSVTPTATQTAESETEVETEHTTETTHSGGGTTGHGGGNSGRGHN